MPFDLQATVETHRWTDCEHAVPCLLWATAKCMEYSHRCSIGIHVVVPLQFMEPTDSSIVETYDIELNFKQASAYCCVCKVMRLETVSPIEYTFQSTSGIQFLEQDTILVKRLLPATRGLPHASALP